MIYKFLTKKGGFAIFTLEYRSIKIYETKKCCEVQTYPKCALEIHYYLANMYPLPTLILRYTCHATYSTILKIKIIFFNLIYLYTCLQLRWIE